MAQYTLSKSKFNTNVPVATATNIIFTYTAVPDGFTGIDISEDADGSVMVWNDGTIYYISTLSTNRVQAPADSSALFAEYTVLTSIDFSYFSTTNVTNMSQMFDGCSSLNFLKLTNFSTNLVTTMQKMFYNCTSLYSIEFGSSFDTSKVTDMALMFDRCNALTSLDLSNFNTALVTDMTQMFGGCEKLTALDLSSFDTSEVTKMSSMFNGCYKLHLIDLSSFNTSKVTSMFNMFNQCYELTSLDLSNFDTSQVEYIYSMFYQCWKLIALDLSNFDTSKVTNMNNMFSACNKLEKITLGKLFKWLPEKGLNTPTLDGADGNWYDVNGVAYAPTAIPSNVSMTYYASKPLYEADLTNWKNITYQTIDNYKEAIHNKDKIKLKELANGIKSLHFNIYTDSDMEV